MTRLHKPFSGKNQYFKDRFVFVPLRPPKDAEALFVLLLQERDVAFRQLNGIIYFNRGFKVFNRNCKINKNQSSS